MPVLEISKAVFSFVSSVPEAAAAAGVFFFGGME
jgi:hypothetical protein